MPRSGLLVIISLLLLPGCVRRNILESSAEHRLGDALVRSVLYRAEGSDLILLNLHENEATSVEAGLHLIRRTGGAVLTLRHTGERMISFALGNDPFQIDPNRIFTDNGARRTLSSGSPPPEEAFRVVRGFAREILDRYRFDERSVIITLHNNTEEAYSVLSYLPGAEYQLDASKVYVNLRKDPDDFYFVTTDVLFDGLKSRGFNVVLQNNRFASDDGSLSVLAGLKGIPYVNVEAQQGHLREQRRMLEALIRQLAR